MIFCGMIETPLEGAKISFQFRNFQMNPEKAFFRAHSMRATYASLIWRPKKWHVRHDLDVIDPKSESSSDPRTLDSLDTYELHIFVSTKFHFDETISLAGLVSLLDVVVRPTFMGTLRWDNFCNFGATLLRFGTVFTNILLLWIRNFEKHWSTPTPK